MTSADLPLSPAATMALPDRWRSEIVALLAGGESVVACLELDATSRKILDRFL